MINSMKSSGDDIYRWNENGEFCFIEVAEKESALESIEAEHKNLMDRFVELEEEMMKVCN